MQSCNRFDFIRFTLLYHKKSICMEMVCTLLPWLHTKTNDGIHVHIECVCVWHLDTVTMMAETTCYFKWLLLYRIFFDSTLQTNHFICHYFVPIKNYRFACNRQTKRWFQFELTLDFARNIFIWKTFKKKLWQTKQVM